MVFHAKLTFLGKPSPTRIIKATEEYEGQIKEEISSEKKISHKVRETKCKYPCFGVTWRDLEFF